MKQVRDGFRGFKKSLLNQRRQPHDGQRHANCRAVEKFMDMGEPCITMRLKKHFSVRDSGMKKMKALSESLQYRLGDLQFKNWKYEN